MNRAEIQAHADKVRAKTGYDIALEFHFTYFYVSVASDEISMECWFSVAQDDWHIKMVGGGETLDRRAVDAIDSCAKGVDHWPTMDDNYEPRFEIGHPCYPEHPVEGLLA